MKKALDLIKLGAIIELVIERNEVLKMKIVKFYMMKKDNGKKSLKALNNTYIKEFCGKFGGCTTYDAKGYYVSSSGKLYKDSDTVAEIFVDTKKAFNDNKKAMVSYFRDIAKRYKKEAKQEAVSVVIDGHVFIIE